MPTYTYPVFAFRQQAQSPIQVAFVAPAGEILQWAGIPRKSDELLTGYQRFRDEIRVDEEIVPFFHDAKNCSPTAIILALRKDTGSGGCVLEGNGMANLQPGVILEGKLQITLNLDESNPEHLFQSALNYVSQRLTAAGETEETAADEASEVAEEEQDQEEESDDETGDGEEAIHLGSETLLRMKTLLENREYWENAAFRKAVADYVKPAFLIDGQHRVTGAARLGLPFIVCGLYDAAWEEQVFQFTVVNLKPKKIPPNTITSIAALSLTRHEQQELERRLENAGVKMWEVTLMSHVSFDTASPFVEKVDMAVGDPKAGSQRLGYGAIKRVAAVWYKCKYAVLNHLAKNVAASGNLSKARKEWQKKD